MRTFDQKWILFGLVILLSGCGGGGSTVNDEPENSEAFLQPVSSSAELEAAIKSAFTTPRPSDPSPTTDSSAAGFSSTYTQEPNVDEFDTVRYDGEYLYVAPRRYVGCCFLADEPATDGSENTGTPAQSSIRIMATDATTGDVQVTSSIPLEENVTVQGMYTDASSLFALTATAYYGSYGSPWADLSVYVPERLGYRVYDLTDRTMPNTVAEVEIDGVFVESRRIGDTVYIISRYAPDIDGLIFAPQTDSEIANNQAILANVSLDELTPTITINGVQRSLVDPQQCLIVRDVTETGYPVLTNITAVSVDDPTEFRNVCFNDNSFGAYVSQTAVYFSRVVALDDLGRTGTRIHKFALFGSAASYRGSIEVAGVSWRGGQADFRMSELDGALRVVTTEFTSTSGDSIDHFLYVIAEATGGTSLEVVGQLPNPSRPTPIGKPNEQLYGVRFLGDRAYLVTFERIDPLYAIDLSDNSDPRIAGELTVTGFSDFLHPVSDELLLGLGRAESGALKFELFDVQNLASPLSRGSIEIGDNRTYSEALYNRHAFTYLAALTGPDRLTIPIERIELSDNLFSSRTSLGLFEIADKETPSLASIRAVGELSIDPSLEDDQYFFSSRAFIDQEFIFWVRDETVWSANWNLPEVLNGPF
ncbi:MAG: beta-propeller domain-containing protein [Pseudomonadota bacterium]